MHVVNVDINYRSTARMGDELVNGLRVAAIRDSSIEFSWRCRGDDDTVIAEGGMTYAAVAAGGGGRRVSASFRDAVVAYQDVPPDPV